MSWVLLTLPGLPGAGEPVPGVLVLAGVGAGLATVAGTGYALGRRVRPRPGTAPDTNQGAGAGADRRAARERWAELALTVTAAGIATAVAVNGMWHVFGDVLGFTGAGRIALAGFLEVALMVSAIRARRSLREHGTVGVDGAAVWALALLSAVLAALDADGLARVVRFAAPLVAAWLWERGLAAERRRARARTPVVIAWRWTRERVAVRLGLAEPAQRAAGEVDRARRLATLTRARLRVAVLESSRLPTPLAVLTLHPVRHALALWRLQRHALAAVEHLHLGTDPTIPATIRTTVAAVVGLRQATAPAALTTASPWTQPAEPAVLVPVAGSDVGADRIGSDRGSDRDQGRDVDRIGAGAVAARDTQARVSTTSMAPRGEDVDRLTAAIQSGDLPDRPSVEAVRSLLRISPSYARAARDAVLNGASR